MSGQRLTVLSETLAPPFDPGRAVERTVLTDAGADLIEAGSLAEWRALAPHADAVLHWRVPIGKDEIGLLGSCRVIAHYGVGVDRIDVEAADLAGIFVCNVPDYGVEEVADHAMMLLLAGVRWLPDLERTVRAGGWGVADARPLARLRGLTLGILGLGRIGSAVARRATAFGLRVIAADPYAPEDRFRTLSVAPVDFRSLLSQSDVISLHAPLTAETRGLIDRVALASAKPGVVLVNTSRGAVIDELALIEALDRGIVSAAGLDVFETEPLPAESPFRGHPRVILTPHAAYFSESSIVDMQAGAARQIVSAFAGRTPDAVAALPGITWSRAARRWTSDVP